MKDFKTANIHTDGAPFPNTKSKEATGGAANGTQFLPVVLDEIWGFIQALMVGAGLVPSGVVESASVSQILEAIEIVAFNFVSTFIDSGDITDISNGAGPTIADSLDTIVADDWVNADRIATDAVTTSRIKDSNVTGEKIGALAITTDKVADGNITEAKLEINLKVFKRTYNAAHTQGENGGTISQLIFPFAAALPNMINVYSEGTGITTHAFPESSAIFGGNMVLDFSFDLIAAKEYTVVFYNF